MRLVGVPLVELIAHSTERAEHRFDESEISITLIIDDRSRLVRYDSGRASKVLVS